jgi:hypothetical protein
MTSRRSAGDLRDIVDGLADLVDGRPEAVNEVRNIISAQNKTKSARPDTHERRYGSQRHQGKPNGTSQDRIARRDRVASVVRRGGRKELVQCKQWKTRCVSAPTVREMWGLVDHHRADAVHIVCIGDFTPDAMAFARGKAIELIGGKRLLEMVREVQRNPDGSAVDSDPHSRTEPVLSCPACGSDMVQRRNRQNGERFWGCAGYPRCRGTRPA